MRGNPTTARLHREWLRQALAHARITPTALAKAIKISPSTLTRPLKEGDDGTSTLHAATIEKISEYTGMAAPGVASAAPQLVRGVLREDGVPYQPTNDALDAAIDALIAGRNSADPWTLTTRALELAGYLPGDVVIVDLGRTAQVGDIVCAQVNIDFNRGTADTVMRLFDKIGGTELLAAATLDPAIRKFIAVDDRVAIKGVIVGMVRPRPQAAA